MSYRDLIPSRLGGRYIASHIIVGPGGQVADWVHYHRVTLQLIYVRKGSVRVVYEDQGDPFEISEGDLVVQPPLIRHRVLECSSGAEVIELSAPALHETVADHELVLPNRRRRRLFGNQRFLWHRAAATRWTVWNGAEAQESAALLATARLADVRTIRRGRASTLDVPAHDGELVFAFILEGRGLVNGTSLGRADAFVMPPSLPWSINDMTEDFRMLHITTAPLDGAA